MTLGTIISAIVGLLSVGGHVTSVSAALQPREDIFGQVFTVFLALGTVVFIVVTVYMVYSAYKYRHGSEHSKKAPEDERPVLGEVPAGGGGGKKLALSFTLSAIIVLSLIIWTYGLLLHVETGAAQTEAADKVEVEVEGYQFGWDFTYENGHTTTNTLRVPQGTVVELRVTSQDVFHAIGSPPLRFKADAIPGQYTDTWFIAEETGTYQAQCYELCGAGHSYMTAEIIVMEPQAYQDWYESAGNESSNGGNGNGSSDNGNESSSMTAEVAL